VWNKWKSNISDVKFTQIKIKELDEYSINTSRNNSSDIKSTITQYNIITSSKQIP
jgi:hypothetical protein